MLLAVIWAGASLFASVELYRFVSQPAAEPPEPEPDKPTTEVDVVAGDSAEAVVVVPDEPDPFDQIGNSLGLSFGALGLSLLGAVMPVARMLSIPLLVVSIVPVVRDSWAHFRETRRVNFMGLTAIGTTLELALGYTSLAAFGWILFTSGRALQSRTRRQAAADLQDAFEKHGDYAWLLLDGVEVQVLIKDITTHDRLIVRTGEPIPLDGTIIEGLIAVDQRALTGESRLKELGVGDEVLAATLVLSGTAIIAPTRTGSATVAARVEALLAETESFEQRLRARAEIEADRSVRPTYSMMIVGVVTHGLPGVLAGFWTNNTDLFWFGAPYNVVNSVHAAARSSILIKDGRSLEQIANVDTIVFDKTGTLTLDSFEVVRVHGYADMSELEVLSFAAALEQRQQHPIARAIVDAADRARLPIPKAEELRSTLGYGMSARIEGRATLIGSALYMATEAIELPAEAEDVRASASALGHSLIYMGVEGRCVGLIELAPEIRPEATELLIKLRARGLEIMMVTGDDEGPSAALAQRLGIDSYRARALPEDKDRIVAELQAEGRIVCFVGDGLNDGLALKRANVSISMTGASFVAIESAQILLQAGSLEHLALVFEFSDHFVHDQNLIMGTSRFLTVAASLALMFFSFALPAIVWMYAAGFGFTVVTSSLPQLREYAGTRRKTGPRPTRELPKLAAS